MKQKDYFGREMLVNDLILTKTTGRNGTMKHGILLDTGSIYTGKGSTSSSGDRVKMVTTGDLYLEKIRLDLIADRESYVTKLEESRKKSQANRIKKKDFKRFTVYDSEMFIGDCLIDGNPHKDTWITMDRYSKIVSKFGEPILRLYETAYHYSSQSRGTELVRSDRSIRSVVYPKKLEEGKSYTLEDVQRMLDFYWELPCYSNDSLYIDCRNKGKFLVIK